MTILNGDMTAKLPHVTFYVGLAWDLAFLGNLTANLYVSLVSW